MIRSLVALVVSSTIVSPVLAQTTPEDEALRKELWEYCQSKLKGTASKEGCTHDGQKTPTSWSHVAVHKKLMQSAGNRPLPPPTAEEQKVRDFCEKRMGGTAVVPGCFKNSDFIKWPDVALRMKQEADIRHQHVEPGQWRLAFRDVVVSITEPGVDASRFKPPPTMERCLTRDQLEHGLIGSVVQMMADCQFVRNNNVDGKADIGLKCKNAESDGTIAANGTITPKQFAINYEAAFVGLGAKKDNRMHIKFALSGDWLSADCK